MFAALLFLALAPKVPTVAWLPPVSKDMTLFKEEPVSDRDRVRRVAYPLIRSGLAGKFHTPDIGQWNEAMGAAGLDALENGSAKSPEGFGYNLVKAIDAAKKVGADYVAATWISKVTCGTSGFDTSWFRMSGALTLVDVKTGHTFLLLQPESALYTISGPASKPFDIGDVVGKFTAAVQTSAAYRISVYQAGKK